MVVLAGGELFTGNTAYLTVALAEGKATPMQVRSAPPTSCTTLNSSTSSLPPSLQSPPLLCSVDRKAGWGARALTLGTRRVPQVAKNWFWSYLVSLFHLAPRAPQPPARRPPPPARTMPRAAGGGG